MFTVMLKKISMLSSKNKRGKLYLIKESVKHTDKLLSKHWRLEMVPSLRCINEDGTWKTTDLEERLLCKHGTRIWFPESVMTYSV